MSDAFRRAARPVDSHRRGGSSWCGSGAASRRGWGRWALDADAVGQRGPFSARLSAAPCGTEHRWAQPAGRYMPSRTAATATQQGQPPQPTPPQPPPSRAARAKPHHHDCQPRATPYASQLRRTRPAAPAQRLPGRPRFAKPHRHNRHPAGPHAPSRTTTTASRAPLPTPASSAAPTRPHPHNECRQAQTRQAARSRPSAVPQSASSTPASRATHAAPHGCSLGNL